MRETLTMAKWRFRRPITIAMLGSVLSFVFVMSVSTHSFAMSVAAPLVGMGSKCLDNKQGQLVLGNPIQLMGCNGGVSQKWVVDAETGEIRNQGWCLDIKNSGITPGTLVQLYTCNGTNAQKWVVKPNNSIVNPASGLCLDDKNSSSADGNPIQIYTCQGNNGQTWKLQTRAMYEPVDGKTYLGASLNVASQLTSFKQTTGVPDHLAIYNGFPAPNGSMDMRYAAIAQPELSGTTPMISWSVDFRNGAITSGSQDTYLHQQATLTRNYNKPVFIRLNWEMNGTWNPTYSRQYVSPAEYIASWKYIYSIFKAEAPNAAFVWCPNEGRPYSVSLGAPTPLPTATWYPGDNYVDWMCVDVYPDYNATPSNVLTEPDGLNDLANYAAAHDKPLMVGEWARGNAGNLPDSPDTVNLMFDWAAQYPNTVKAMLYFDVTNDYHHEIETRPITAQAYRNKVVGNSRYIYDLQP